MDWNEKLFTLVSTTGPLERRLPPGEDIEIHFQSRNVKEENGAVIVTFQSQVDGFKGKALSTEDSLKRSAAIRLISRIVKEPFFNELRTKQQLGYVSLNFPFISSRTFLIISNDLVQLADCQQLL